MPYYRRNRRYSGNGYSERNRQKIAERRAAGLVLVARGTYEIKGEIKAAGGLWDAETRGWAMPDVDTYNTFAARVGAGLLNAVGGVVVVTNALVQPESDQCGRCKTLIADEYGCEVAGYYNGPISAGTYEQCPSCSHAFAVA